MPLKLGSQHFNLIVIVLFQFQYAGVEKNNWKCVTIQIHMGHIVHRMLVCKC